MNSVRVRFAPSPTGLLHLGNARTALFNWLFARCHHGKFVLRVEDTDVVRNDPDSERGIYVSLRWLGLLWDEGPKAAEDPSLPGRGELGPYRQSERTKLYERVLEELRAAGKVYPCFCSELELEQERRKLAAAGQAYRYSGRCRELRESERQERLVQGAKPVWRFRVPAGAVAARDEIRGQLSFDSQQIGDFVAARANGRVTYNFACVVDDHLMEITHVIRGEDHLSNTPKQVLLYQALNWEPPQFAHLPLLTGPDHKPLSKRHGDTSLDYFYAQGYLPAALVNFMALLGWSSPDGEEILTLDHMAEHFSLERVHKAAAVFDLAKLKWMNGKYLRRLPPEALYEQVSPHLEAAGYDLAGRDRAWWVAAVDSVRDNLDLLSDAEPALRIYLGKPQHRSPEAEKLLREESASKVLKAFAAELAGRSTLNEEQFAEIVADLKKKLGLKDQALLLPLRAALTGEIHGPELKKVATLLGLTKVRKRLELAQLIKE
jgi:nondiscriminating glutamyl-tRNA synthetase